MRTAMAVLLVSALGCAFSTDEDLTTKTTACTTIEECRFATDELWEVRAMSAVVLHPDIGGYRDQPTLPLSARNEMLPDAVAEMATRSCTGEWSAVGRTGVDRNTWQPEWDRPLTTLTTAQLIDAAVRLEVFDIDPNDAPIEMLGTRAGTLLNAADLATGFTTVRLEQSPEYSAVWDEEGNLVRGLAVDLTLAFERLNTTEASAACESEASDDA